MAGYCFLKTTIPIFCVYSLPLKVMQRKIYKQHKDFHNNTYHIQCLHSYWLQTMHHPYKHKFFFFGQSLNLWFTIFPLFCYRHCWHRRVPQNLSVTLFYDTYVLCKITVNKHSVQQKMFQMHCPYLHKTQYKTRLLPFSSGAGKIRGVPRNFCWGGGGFQLRTESRQNGDLGAVAP